MLSRDGNQMLRFGQIGRVRTAATAEMRRELVARARARSNELVDSVAARYRHELAAHAEPGRAFEAGVTRRLAQVTVNALLSAVEDATPLRDGLPVDLSAQSLMVSSLPTAAILSAYEAAAGMVWRFLTEELADMDLNYDQYGDMLAAVGGMIFEVSARMSGALRHRLGLDGNGSSENADDTKQNVFNALLVSSHLGERTLADAAERVGFRLGESHVVVLVGLRKAGRGGKRPTAAAAAEIEAILRGLHVGNQVPIIESLASDIVAIFPSKREGVRRRLATRLTAALRNVELPGGVDVRVALGGEVDGIVGISASYDQARRTLDAIEATSMSERVVAYPEMLPTLLLIENPRLAAEIKRSTVDQLERYDVDQQGDLVATLEALVAEQGNVSGAAKRLHVHRHTLAARHEQIERITGLRLRVPREMLMLELGLQAAQIPPANEGR
jgi:PucR C-terminal helix-turn-helix domain/GGDEF-like domain